MTNDSILIIMQRILLKCPQCGTTRFQKIPQQMMESRNQCKKGIVAILIPEKTVCEHMFVVHVDTHFTVRDALLIVAMVSLASSRCGLSSRLASPAETLKTS